MESYMLNIYLNKNFKFFIEKKKKVINSLILNN
jgi:hypothetical protein